MLEEAVRIYGGEFLPGTYAVNLTVDGKTYTQSLLVKMDPRVKTPLEGLRQQFAFSKEMYDGIVTGRKTTTGRGVGEDHHVGPIAFF